MTTQEGGRCEEIEEPRILNPDEWSLVLNQEGCAGGMLVKLRDPPPAGAEVIIEFQVEVQDEGPAPVDDGSGPVAAPSEMMPAAGGSILSGGAASEVSPRAGNAEPGGSPAGPMGGALIGDSSAGLNEMTLPGGQTEITAGRMASQMGGAEALDEAQGGSPSTLAGGSDELLRNGGAGGQ